MAVTRLEAMKQAALDAGAFMRGQSTSDTLTNKTNTKDFVTVADIKSQDMIRERLSDEFPEAVILSEEDTEQERQALYATDFTGYVLDPIDGTYNFKRDMRESAISIGYIENGQALAGVIYDPYKDELFVAQKGEGATRNGETISVSGQQELAGASVATSNSYDDAGMARNLKRHLSIYESEGTMPWTSCPGSGVLIMAWIACGRIDAYHHNGLKPWDNAAALLLITEAGGVIEALAGGPALFTSSALLLGTPAIVKQIRTIFDEGATELLA